MIRIVRSGLKREPLQASGIFNIPLPADQGLGLGKPLKILVHPERDTIPIWVASLGDKNVEMTAELADGWLPILFIPERANDVWGDSLAAGAAKRDPELGPLQISAGGMVAIGEDVKGLLDFLRPMYALYVGGMGARGKNFYNELAAALRLREGGQGDPGPLPRRQEEGGRGPRPDGVDGAEQPGRPGVVRPGADRRLQGGRRQPPLDRPGHREPGRDDLAAQGLGVMRLVS